MLDYHLDYRIRLTDEREHKSLYGWCFQEIDENGKKVGRDLIPWNWSLYFSADELTLREELDMEMNHLRKEGPEREIKSSESISAKLRSGFAHEERSNAAYSMMGTKREIEDFRLWIHPVDEGKPEEFCAAWGSLSYTSEHDFRDVTMEDTLQFYLRVSPERFARYVEMIRRYPASTMVLRLKDVHGFYSDWSPSISTDSVKVLCRMDEHKVEVPEGFPIDPPVLGEIGKFELTFQTTRQCEKPPRPVEAVFEDKGEENALSIVAEAARSPDEEGVILQRAIVKLALEHARRLKHLSWAAWTIVAVLLFLLFK